MNRRATDTAIKRIPWANAHRLRDDHERELAWIEGEAVARYARGERLLGSKGR